MVRTDHDRTPHALVLADSVDIVGHSDIVGLIPKTLFALARTYETAVYHCIGFGEISLVGRAVAVEQVDDLVKLLDIARGAAIVDVRVGTDGTLLS